MTTADVKCRCDYYACEAGTHETTADWCDSPTAIVGGLCMPCTQDRYARRKCLCPSDCGCKPWNIRPNICGCKGHD